MNYLDQVEAQLSRLTEQGAHRRLRARTVGVVGGRAGGPRPPRRRSEWLAVGAAVAAVAVVAAVILLTVHTSPQHTTASSASHAHKHALPAPKTSTHTATATTSSSATAPATPAPGTVGIPIPAHFYPVSFTAISELTWWVLGEAPCTFAGVHPPCAEILRTTDGGRHFLGVPAPRATLAPTGSSAGSPASASVSVFSQLRFADAKNGFAYGPGLYATHDGGVTWHAVHLGGAVNDLEITAGQVYAVLSTGGGNAGHLMRSPVDHDAWSTVSAAGLVSGGLWVQGSQVIVQSGIGTGIGGNVLISNDGGKTFAAHPAPSPGLPCQFESPAPPVVWAHCATGTESGVWRSTDSGARFRSAEKAGAGLMLPNSAAFAAASDTTAVVGYQQLYRTADAGATYTHVGPSGIAQWSYLGFTDSTHGVALGYAGSIAPANARLYYTTDGGRSYHLVPLP